MMATCANCGLVEVVPRKSKSRLADGTYRYYDTWVCREAERARLKKYHRSAKALEGQARRRAAYALQRRRARYQALIAAALLLERTDHSKIDPDIEKQYLKIIDDLRKQAKTLKTKYLDPAAKQS